jgi:hypothetical protein
MPAHDGDDRMKGFVEPLKAASKQMQAAGMFFMQKGMKNPDAALAGSYDFMHLMGHVCLGLMWTRMARPPSYGAGRRPRRCRLPERPRSPPAAIYMARQLPPAPPIWRGSKAGPIR